MIVASEILGWSDPLAFTLVLGGSCFVAAARATAGEFARAFGALVPLLRRDPDADAEAARRAVARVEKIAEAKGIVCADRVATTGRFLTEAVRRLADAPSSEAFARWADELLEARAKRHAGVVHFWSALADAAPAMGMIATVLGLVRMFSNLDDPRSIGAPMATALIGTLLGLIVANCIAGPIASRLERLSEAEIAWQRRTLDHFLRLARAELDQPAGQAAGLQRTLARRYAA